MAEDKVVKEGFFSVTVEKPDGTKEEFSPAPRTLEVVGGNIVVTNTQSGTVTICPPGSAAKTSR